MKPMISKNNIIRIFYVINNFLFLILILNCLFSKQSISNNKIVDYTVMLTAFVGICVIFTCTAVIIQKNKAWIERHYRHILISFLTILGSIQLILGYYLEFTPAFDFEAVFCGAVEWLEKGDFSSFHDYYYYFPNNLGAMALLKKVFSVAKFFGIKDYFFFGTCFNCILSLSTMLVTSLVCKKLFGKDKAVFVLLFFAVSLPFYFIAPVFYTDALSMLFPILFYYFYLCWKENVEQKKSKTKQWFITFAMGIVLTMGMLIKFTVLIMLIAVLLDRIFSIKNRNTLIESIKMAGICFLIMILGFTLLQTEIYEKHLDKEIAKERNTPYLHWVMMGLKGNGRYNGEDYEYTRSIPAKERNKELIHEIERRVRQQGIKGMSRLWLTKSEICFGDGSYALSDFLDDSPKHTTFLNDVILYGGSKYPIYERITMIVLLWVYFLMILAGREREEVFCTKTACFGILLFLLFWEASGRYFTNFVPVFFINAMFGVTNLENKVRQNLRKLGWIQSLQSK